MKDIFHIKRREKYQISDFFLYSIRKVAKALQGSASSLNAIILIHRIFHHICLRYREEKEGNVFNDSFVGIANRVSFFEDTLLKFIDDFSLQREDFIEELLLLSLAYENPSFSLYKRLFSLKNLKYKEIKGYIFEYFKEKPEFGPFNQSLPEMLKTPQRLFPNSLSGQLLYIKDNWAHLLSKELLESLLLGLDLIKEEEALRMMGKAPLEILDFKGDFLRGFGPDYERFSRDAFWMPKVVMLAKNTYVWLAQLSKKYGRWIRRLDDVPDEELDELASYGFNAIWLIGLWERSDASSKIKQMTGNPEAVSSAYSLYDYVIAQDLGGEDAFQNLRSRCWQRGIRLAGDMVPNHIGIYSKWVIEYPDWFIQLDYPPFPRYSFTGPNLSNDSRVGVYLEDGYWTRQDAAVVFKRIDHWTGDTKYIYHGNDGTHMPWNDTAQLNFLKEEVREAVIQTILHCARKFPIIRFDAAMTLTKFHYQRLWFPEPGSGGAIPSRAEFGMRKSEFDKAFPQEFWKEVVDRVAQEIPDTLLLAEAFWLMEGYFVRTLGMHRVYNSAFMNMLKLEDNAKYRSVIKNVLGYNPMILERFVNFMSNPDEETAIAQFGKDDKYFGVCLMMVTLPGLCMFSHGQIEGLEEKYGMEYKRPYWDEIPDWNLVERHKREIFPLLKKRYLFSGVSNFYLFDFWTNEGYVNEDVFAYTNRCGDERAIIVYHNKYATTSGWIKVSSARLEGKRLIQRDLVDCLSLKRDSGYYYIFRDHKSGLEYIRKGCELSEKGLYIELSAFKYHIFLDFREVFDKDGRIGSFCSFLNGRGVFNIEYEIEKFSIKEEIRGRIPQKYIRFLDVLSLWYLYERKEKIECSEREALLFSILSSHPNWDSDLAGLLDDSLVKRYIQLNEYQGILYFNKESFEELIDCLFLVSSILYPEKAKEKEAL
ncbi:MAG: alpha-amylase family glycosyl hydrolase, partial [bacterium]